MTTYWWLNYNFSFSIGSHFILFYFFMYIAIKILDNLFYQYIIKDIWNKKRYTTNTHKITKGGEIKQETSTKQKFIGTKHQRE